MLDYVEIQKKLQSIQQPQLLASWEELSLYQQQRLLEQLSQIQEETLIAQQKTLSSSLESFSSLEPFKDYEWVGNKSYLEQGEQLIKKGKVGCLLIAGGQGTRLGFEGPKGCYPISFFHHKTLFQIFVEKLKAASHQAGVPLKMAIMTSPLNHHQTVSYFEENQYFGCQKQISFFSQSMLPFLTPQGNLFLESEDTLAQGPDGNGSALTAFWKSNLGPQWLKDGIEILNFILIDNPLGDPFDKELIGFHEFHQNEISIKSIEKDDPTEKVGVLVKKDKQIEVIEYSELPLSLAKARDSDQKLTYRCANISNFCWNMQFIEKKHLSELPLHKCLKPAKYWPPAAEQSEAWKFEYFIFDWLKFSNKVKALIYPRFGTFSPLKNSQGLNSVAQVQQDMMTYDKFVLENITKIPILVPQIEIDAQFHYPTLDLLKKWHHLPVRHSGYIPS